MKVLETERLLIRNFTVDDWPDLYDIVIKYQASEYAQYDHQWPTDPDEIKGVAGWFASGDNYLAVALETTKVIGFICLNREKNADGRVFGLGYVFHSDYQGQGYATEGCRAMLDRAFGTLEADKVTANTAATNVPSCRLLERLGMKETGREMASFRQTEDGKPVAFEAISFVISRDEWARYNNEEARYNNEEARCNNEWARYNKEDHDDLG